MNWNKKLDLQRVDGDTLFVEAYTCDEDTCKCLDIGYKWAAGGSTIEMQLKYLTENQIGDLIHLLEELKEK